MSQQLSGSHFHTIDDKKRIRIPAPFRKELGSELYIGLGRGRGLFVMTKEERDRQMEEAFGAIGFSDDSCSEELHKESLKKRGLSFAINEDSQGRFIIPPPLLKFSGIKSSVITVGNGKRIEIWAEEKYWEYTGLADIFTSDEEKISEDEDGEKDKAE